MSLDDFRTANPLHRLNRAVQIVLALGLLLGLNALNTRSYWRSDLSRTGLYSLSPETTAYLHALDQPVHVIVTIPADSGGNDEQELLYRYVRNLLEEYRDAARQGGEERLTLEFVDPFRNLKRAEELSRLYQMDQPYVVLFTSGRRQRVVVPSEVLEFRDMEPVAFKGEQAFTSALLETTSGEAPTLYFLTGHGEMGLDEVSPSRGLSGIAQELRARNLMPQPLDLSAAPVPDNAGLIIIADPQGPLLAGEVERLRSYLGERAGRVVLLTSAGRDHGLDALLQRYGIETPDMVVLENGNDYVESAGGFLVRQFAEHPVTVPLVQNSAPVLAGLARPVAASKTAAEPGTRVTLLMASSLTSWGERGWRVEDVPRYDAGYDLPGPVSLAAIAQTGASSETGISLPGSRLAVVGIGDLVSNRRVPSFGNHAFFFSLVNWMLDREQVIAMQPRPIQRYQLPLSQDDLREILLMLLIPAGLAALLGIAVALARRY